MAGSCENCHVDYDLSRDHQPRVLSCLHTYCMTCCILYAQRGQGKHINCPRCSSLTSLDSSKGINSLQLNYQIIKELEIRKKQELFSHTILLCHNCEKNESIWRCIDCNDECCNLCTECKIQHTQLKALRNHQLITMNEYKNSINLFVLKENFYCEKHLNELLEVYCCDCRIPLCLTCAVYDHNTHTRKTIEDGVKIESHDITQHIHNVNDLMDIYERETDSVEGIANNLTHQNELIKKNITLLFQELHQLLQEREDTLQGNLQQLYQLKYSLLSQQITSLRQSIANSRLSTTYATTTLEETSPLQTILLSPSIRSHLSVLSSLHLNTIPQTQSDLLFDSSSLQMIRNLIASFGNVCDDSTPIPSLCQLEQGSISIVPVSPSLVQWKVVFYLYLRKSNGDLMIISPSSQSHSSNRPTSYSSEKIENGGMTPLITVKLFDLTSQTQFKKGKEEVYDSLPYTLKYEPSQGRWKVEVLSSQLSGMVVDASLSGENVQFSPLMATRGPEITLWGEDAGTILRSSASHLSNITSSYGPDNLRKGGSLKWKTSRVANLENIDESVELGLIDSHCLVGHINLINRKAEFYRLFYRPSPHNDKDTENAPWLPFHLIPPLSSNPLVPEWIEIAQDAKWTIRLSEEECRELGPVSAIRLELKSTLAGSSFCLINVFGWNITN